MKYKLRNIPPSTRVIRPLFPTNRRNIMRRTIAKSSTMISVIRSELTGRSATVPVIPKTSRILKILLPTTFPIAISDCFFNDAITEVTISGADVPNATIVRPITASETPNEDAIDFAELTKSSAPSHSHTSPSRTKIIDFPILSHSISSDCSGSTVHDFMSQNV